MDFDQTLFILSPGQQSCEGDIVMLPSVRPSVTFPVSTQHGSMDFNQTWYSSNTKKDLAPY